MGLKREREAEGNCFWRVLVMELGLVLVPDEKKVHWQEGINVETLWVLLLVCAKMSDELVVCQATSCKMVMMMVLSCPELVSSWCRCFLTGCLSRWES